MSKYHIVIDQVDNGWIFTVMRQGQFAQTPDAKSFVATTVENVCTMLIAEMREEREPKGGSWQR